MSNHSYPLGANDFPYPFGYVPKGVTKREILRHQMINFVPSTYMEVVEVEVQWRNSEYTRLCTDCHKPLTHSGFVAKNADHVHGDYFHIGCVEVERAEDIVRVMVNVTMKRKSQRYPDRLRVVEFIGYAEKLEAYKTELIAAGYPCYASHTTFFVRESDHV